MWGGGGGWLRGVRTAGGGGGGGGRVEVLLVTSCYGNWDSPMQTLAYGP